MEEPTSAMLDAEHKRAERYKWTAILLSRTLNDLVGFPGEKPCEECYSRGYNGWLCVALTKADHWDLGVKEGNEEDQELVGETN